MAKTSDQNPLSLGQAVMRELAILDVNEIKAQAYNEGYFAGRDSLRRELRELLELGAQFSEAEEVE